MDNNYILQQLTGALNIDKSGMIEIFKCSDYSMSPSMAASVLKEKDEEDFLECGDALLILFLEGLIISKRGKKDNSGAVQPDRQFEINNNVVLKKIRIALEFQEEDMLSTFKLAGFDVNRHQLSPLFRKNGSKHYKNCSDQMLENFIQGLAVRFKK